MNNRDKERLRRIPSIDKILSKKEIKHYLQKLPRKFVRECCNTE